MFTETIISKPGFIKLPSGTVINLENVLYVTPNKRGAYWLNFGEEGLEIDREEYRFICDVLFKKESDHD